MRNDKNKIAEMEVGLWFNQSSATSNHQEELLQQVQAIRNFKSKLLSSGIEPLLGISILYMAEIHLIVPFPQKKRNECKPRSHVWFCNHTIIHLTMITEVNRM